jgi:phospholipase/carboxylesterase
MTSDRLECITIPAATNTPTGAIVLLHGWGANHHDLVELVPYFGLSNYQFLCPNGIFDHDYTETGKMWYSFTGAGELTERSRNELATSRRVLTEWIQELPSLTGIPLDRTWIGGFSQGGAMTLDVGLNLPIAGLFVLSGYLHPDRTPPQIIPSISIVHGTLDDVVPITAARSSRDLLLSWGAEVEYFELEMGHTIVPEVLKILRNRILKSQDNERI